MKNLIMAVLILPSLANASPWSGKLGLNYSSIGTILVHDFAKQATVTGIQWDTLHILYNNNEVGELGLFGGKRDIDSHIICGPSLGVPGGHLGTIASNAQQIVDWPILKTIEDYGKYVHAYVNIGYDFTHLDKSHAKPDLIGLGGVIKFGSVSNQ